jgi:hypothetical protein
MLSIKLLPALKEALNIKDTQTSIVKLPVKGLVNIPVPYVIKNINQSITALPCTLHFVYQLVLKLYNSFAELDPDPVFFDP